MLASISVNVDGRRNESVMLAELNGSFLADLLGKVGQIDFQFSFWTKQTKRMEATYQEPIK